MFALALWALVWSLRVCVLGDFSHKPDSGSHVFLVDVVLHSWIIHGEQVAHNTACGSSSALHLLMISRRIWTLVFHIPVAASTKPTNPSLASLLCTCYRHGSTHSSRQTAQGQGRYLDSPAPRFRIPLPPLHLIQKVQNLTNSPDGTLLIILSQSVFLSTVSDFKRKCFIQKQRQGNFLNF